MRKIGLSLIIILFIIAIKFHNTFFMDNLLQNEDQISLETPIVEKEVNQELSNASNQKDKQLKLLKEDGLHTLIGKKADFVFKKYGEPVRVDITPYDYEWWIYPDVYESGYLQIGVEDHEVVTVYGIGEDLPTAPFHLDAPYKDIEKMGILEKEISVSIHNNSYKFTLTDEEIKTKPLISAGSIFIQLYFDQFTNQLSSIRYLNGATLIKHRPYSVVYRGKLIEPNTLSNSQWRNVEKGAALQVFQITNEIRKKNNLNELLWDDETATVAYLHSQDMKENDYFSHTSPIQGELKDRLKKQGVLYQLAGENIAAKYVDAIEAVTGWLNSEGHRINLLHEDFSHLGVGVYERYYTQNFMTPW